MNIRGTQIQNQTVLGDQVQDRVLTDTQLYSRMYRDNSLFGTIDGTNKTFTTWLTPDTRSLMLYENGVLLDAEGEYTVSGKTVTMVEAPLPDDKLTALYRVTSFPVSERAQFPTFTPVSGAARFLDAYGTVYGIGYNWYIGDNSIINRSSPVSVSVNKRFKKLYAFAPHKTYFNQADYMAQVAYGIDSDGQAWCLGNDGAYSGVGNFNVLSSPMSIARPGSYSKIGPGWALDGSTGQVFVWGNNTSVSPLYNGDGGSGAVSVPTSLARGGSFKDVFRTTPGYASYAIDSTNTLWSWGLNDRGALGIDSTVHQSSPVSVLMTAKVRTVSPYYPMSNAIGWGNGARVHVIDTTGMIWGWGFTDTYGNGGIIGDGSLVSRSSPVMIARPGSYTQVAGMALAVAAIDGSTGHIWSWGSENAGIQAGQLGNGTWDGTRSPVEVLGGRSYTKVVTGWQGGAVGNVLQNCFFLAIDGSGMIYGWGQNGYGTLGCGDTANRNSPTPIARSSSYTDVMIVPTAGIGISAVYAIDGATGTVWGWGYNAQGYFGDGANVSRSSPVSMRFSFY